MIQQSDIPPAREMTFAEYFVFMGRSIADVRRKGMADNDEYMALVNYLVRRRDRHDRR